MKTKLALFMLGLLITLSGFSEGNDREDEQKAYLEIDGKEYSIILDQKSEIKVGDKTYTVKVRLDPYRLFKLLGISFKYSSKLSFVLDDSDPNVTIWSIDGDNISVMINHYHAQLELDELTNLLKYQYRLAKLETKVSDIELVTKSGTLKGKRLDVKMGIISLQQNVFLIKKSGNYIAIVLQDTLKDNGEHTEEYLEMEKVFRDSLEM